MKKLVVFLFIIQTVQIATAKRIEYGTASYYGYSFKGKPTASGELFSPNKLTAAHKTLPLGTVIKVTNEKNNKSVYVRVNDRGPYIKGRVLDLSTKAAELLGYKHKGTAYVKIEVLDNENIPNDLMAASVDVAAQNGINNSDTTSNEAKDILLPTGKEVSNTDNAATTDDSKQMPQPITNIKDANSDGITNRGSYFIVTRIDKSKSGFYGLQLGIFSDMNLLMEAIAEVEAKYGQSHLVEQMDINGKTAYKLYVGKFQNRAYADALKSALTDKYCEALVVRYQ